MFNIIFENDVLAVKKLIEERRYDENDITEKVKEIIEKTGATSMKDMGKVMGYINKSYAGQVDGSVVSKIVKSKLSWLG